MIKKAPCNTHLLRNVWLTVTYSDSFTVFCSPMPKWSRLIRKNDMLYPKLTRTLPLFFSVANINKSWFQYTEKSTKYLYICNNSDNFFKCVLVNRNEKRSYLSMKKITQYILISSVAITIIITVITIMVILIHNAYTSSWGQCQ